MHFGNEKDDELSFRSNYSFVYGCYRRLDTSFDSSLNVLSKVFWAQLDSIARSAAKFGKSSAEEETFFVVLLPSN